MTEEQNRSTGRKFRAFMWRHKWLWSPAVAIIVAIQALVLVRLIFGGDLPPIYAIF